MIGPLKSHSEQKKQDIVKQVWRLALPVMLTNLLQSIVSVVDVFMVGRLGPIPIAGVGMGTAIRMLVLIMMLSVAAGAMSLSEALSIIEVILSPHKSEKEVGQAA